VIKRELTPAYPALPDFRPMAKSGPPKLSSRTGPANAQQQKKSKLMRPYFKRAITTDQAFSSIKSFAIWFTAGTAPPMSALKTGFGLFWSAKRPKHLHEQVKR